jgi:hypothetical protein
MSDWEKDLENQLKTPEQKANDVVAARAAQQKERDRELRRRVSEALSTVARRLKEGGRVIARVDSRFSVGVTSAGDRTGLSGVGHEMYVEPMSEGRELHWVVDGREEARLVFDHHRERFVNMLDPANAIDIDAWTSAIVKHFVEILRSPHQSR